MTIVGARCLVLGGGGFIGINLCDALEKMGATVEGFGRPPHHPSARGRFPWHDADFGDSDRIARAVRDKDFVFHLLGGSVPALSNDDPITDIERSLIPSVRLIDSCRKAEVRRLVFASSGGTVYGVTGAMPVAEDAPTRPITAYGVNKLAVEHYLELSRHLHGFDSITLRIANPYGPFQHSRRAQGIVGALLAKAIAGEVLEIWGDGSIVRDFIHIDDVTAAMIEAATYNGAGRIFNVGSGVGRSMRQITEAVLNVTGLPDDHIRYLPGRTADVPTNILDVRLIRREIGWRPRIDWETGLATTAEWMRSSTGCA